jgi:hypothetical protein
MSLYGVQSFLYRLKREPALQKGLEARDDRTFEGFPVDSDERAAILSGDVAGLYRRGVHPLLLAPYSRFVGISAARYKELMLPAKGSRQLRS